MRAKRRSPILLLALIPGLESSFDHQLGYQVEGSELTRNRFSLFSSYRRKVWESAESGNTLSFQVAGRVWVDPPREDDQAEFQVRALSGTFVSEKFHLTVGYQYLAWGETFGFFIADLVNPRDLRDPLFTESDWVKLPVLAVHPKFFAGNFTFEPVFVPLPRHTLFPPSQAETRELKLRDAELGARAGYLFANGIDLHVFYLSHLNRNAAFEFPRTILEEKSHSIGLTASEAFESVVVRFDGVYHWELPWSARDFGPHLHARQFQAILGSDYSSESWTVGGQFHLDRNWVDRDEDSTFAWVSARVSYPLGDGRWVPELFVFQGLGNGDRWIQPRFSWNVAPSRAFSLKFSVRGDWVWGEAQTDGRFRGYLAPLRAQDRLFTEVSVLF